MNFEHYKALTVRVIPELTKRVDQAVDGQEFYCLVAAHLQVLRREHMTLTSLEKAHLHSLDHATRGRLNGNFVWE